MGLLTRLGLGDWRPLLLGTHQVSSFCVPAEFHAFHQPSDRSKNFDNERRDLCSLEKLSPSAFVGVPQTHERQWPPEAFEASGAVQEFAGRAAKHAPCARASR